MNISFCTVVLSLIQGIALNTEVPPYSQGWGVTACSHDFGTTALLLVLNCFCTVKENILGTRLTRIPV
jgi:hypothetical protein